MSQQQQSSSSFLSNSVLEMDDIFLGLLPDELADSLLADDNFEEGNQIPIDISIAAEPQGYNDEGPNVFNMQQDSSIKLIELGDNDCDSKRKATEEEEKNVNASKKARIDVNVLAERVKELEKIIQKGNYIAGSLGVRLTNKSSSETRTFYLNYVKDGRILNAENCNHEMKKYMVKSPSAKFGYRKCVCPYCQESGIETTGRSNYLLEHMLKKRKIKIQCVYCDKLFNAYRRVKDHVRKYHWKFGENIFLDKENLKE